MSFRQSINQDIQHLKKQSEARPESDLAALARLHRLSTRVFELDALEPLLQEIMDEAVALVGAQFGTLQLLTDNGLRIASHAGHTASFLEFFAHAERQISVCGEALTRGERVVVPDTETSALFAGTESLTVLRKAGIRAIQSTPMLSRSRSLIGILTTQWAQPYVPDEHDLRWLDLVARQAADTLEYVRAREDLQARERELRQTLDTAAVGLTRLDRGMRYLNANPAYARIAGRPLDAIIGHTMGEVLGPEALERARPYIERVLNGETVEYEEQLPWRHAAPGWIHAVYSPWRDRDGGVSGWVASIEDITERKEEQMRRQQSEDTLIAALSAMSDAVFISDAAGNLLHVNKAFASYHRFTSEEECSKQISDFPRLLEAFHCDGRPAPLEEWALPRAIRGERSTNVTYRLRRKDSGESWVGNYSFGPIRRADGAITGAVVVARDTTDMIRVQEELRVKEERLRLATVAAKIGAFDWDLRTGRNVWTPELEAMYGLAAGEFPGSQPAWEQLVHPEDRAGAVAAAREALETARAVEHEWRVIWRDGSEHWIGGRFQGFKDEAGTPIRLSGINIDITHRKQTELALARREAEFRTLAENIPTLCWMADGSGHIYWYNRRWFEYTGTTLEQMRGWGWQSLPDPRVLPSVLERWKQSIASGQAFEMTFPLKGADGVFRPFLTRIAPVRDELGNVVQWFGMNTDVSELEGAQARLREADRQKDEFLAMLAHELRNPLAPIRNVGEFLQRTAGPTERLRTPLEVLMRQTTQLTRLVDDLLDVSRIAQGRIALKRAVHDLADLIDQAIETVQPLLTAKSHDLQIMRPAQPMYVDGDAARLVQVISNVLNNAIKYTDPGGQLRLEVHAAQELVEVQIRDNGCGMSPALLPHAFDLFVQSPRTLDRSQGGLGVGLNVVKRLVEMHGGSVRADSAGEGLGTTVTIRLPRLSSHPVRAASSLQQPTPKRRILVVDDNYDGADSLAILLQSVGHEVQTAYGASAALEKAEQLLPEVILLDIGLPGMDGYEVAARLRQIKTLEGTRLIALTGYGQAHDRERAFAAGFDAHLVKPADLEVLQRLLVEDASP